MRPRARPGRWMASQWASSPIAPMRIPRGFRRWWRRWTSLDRLAAAALPAAQQPNRRPEGGLFRVFYALADIGGRQVLVALLVHPNAEGGLSLYTVRGWDVVEGEEGAPAGPRGAAGPTGAPRSPDAQSDPAFSDTGTPAGVTVGEAAELRKRRGRCSRWATRRSRWTGSRGCGAWRAWPRWWRRSSGGSGRRSRPCATTGA
jgi:hypothetical protein